MSRSKKIIPFIFLLLVCLGGGAWFFLEQTEENSLVLYGNVDQRQVELAFKDTERVAEIFVQEGVTVQPGQVLARIETKHLEHIHFFSA